MIVFGAGGHSKVVIDALLAGGLEPSEITVCDSSPSRHGTAILGLEVTPDSDAQVAGRDFHVAIGAADARAMIADRQRALGGRYASIIHPSAMLSRFATVQDGCFIASGALVGPDARIGMGAIINHGAVVDHDCSVGPFSHVAPNATLGGGVRIGEHSLVGSGATILPGVVVGARAIIGSGAVVVEDVPDGETWVGVPAARSGR